MLLPSLVLLHISHAEGAPLPAWLSSLVPNKGNNLQDEIKCYSLPYGGIGFLSHILTYYVIICLMALRRPYLPFTRLSCAKTDLALSVLQLSGTLSVAIFTMIRCRQSWQFSLIAVWRLGLSLTVGWWSLYASFLTFANCKEGKLSEWLRRFFGLPEKTKDDTPEKSSKRLFARLESLQREIRARRDEIEIYPTTQTRVDQFLPDLQSRLADVSITVSPSRATIIWFANLKRNTRERYWRYKSPPEENYHFIRQQRARVIWEMEGLYQQLHNAPNHDVPPRMRKHAPIRTTYRRNPATYPDPYHLAFYIVFCFIGITGHAGLVAQASSSKTINQGKLEAVNLAFGFIIAGSTMVVLIVTAGVAAIPYMFACAVILTAFWSDWLLGVIANDMTGMPGGDVGALYWAYFAAKRLPLLLS